jgi:hypothetical protein
MTDTDTKPFVVDGPINRRGYLQAATAGAVEVAGCTGDGTTNTIGILSTDMTD